MILAAISLIVGGVVVFWVGHRAQTGQLPRNWVAGIRTRTTMESDEAWYAAQRVGAPFVKAAGIVGVVTGVAALPFSETPAAGIILGGTAVMATLVLVGGARGQRAASDAA